MKCDQKKMLLTGYIDGELTETQQGDLQEHLDCCPNCRQELAQLKSLSEELAMLKFYEPTDAELERYWSGVYNRLERGLGWVFFSIGSIVLLSYGSFKMIEQLIADPTVALAVKIGTVALMLGLVMLFISILRERLQVRRADKYSKEIER